MILLRQRPEFRNARHVAGGIPEIEMPERNSLMELAMRQEGIAYFWGENYTGAIEAIEQYLGDYPESALIPSMAWVLGEAFYAAAQYDDAVHTMETVVERFPSTEYADAALYHCRVVAFTEERFCGGKGGFWQIGKSISPPHVMLQKARFRRGDCFYLHKDFTKAAEMYALVPGLNPSDVEQEYAAYQKAIANVAGR